jgi:hypothetical protein
MPKRHQVAFASAIFDGPERFCRSSLPFRIHGGDLEEGDIVNPVEDTRMRRSAERGYERRFALLGSQVSTDECMIRHHSCVPFPGLHMSQVWSSRDFGLLGVHDSMLHTVGSWRYVQFDGQAGIPGCNQYASLRLKRG